MVGLQWLLREAPGLALTPSLLPVAVLPGGWGGVLLSARVLGAWLQALVLDGTGVSQVCEKPPHLALLAEQFKKVIFLPLIKILMYIVGNLE